MKKKRYKIRTSNEKNIKNHLIFNESKSKQKIVQLGADSKHLEYEYGIMHLYSGISQIDVSNNEQEIIKKYY